MTTATKHIRFLLFLSLCVVMVSCQDRNENSILELSLSNTYDEDLYIFLNVWHVSKGFNTELIDDFSLSKNLVVNKIISSNTRVEYNNQFPHPFNTTITLTHKEPVFLEFNKSDSIIFNIKIKENIKNYPSHIQLISFSKKEIAASEIEYLLFSKKKLSIDLTKSMSPFEDNEMLDSINNFGYFDSINIVPIELVINQ